MYKSAAPLPPPAWPSAIGVLVLVPGAFVAFGFGAAAFVFIAAVMGWATGVLHERYLPSEVDPTDTRAMIVTLGPGAAQTTRDLAVRQGVRVPETLRRGLMLLDLFTNLAPGQELAVVDRDSGVAEPLRPLWIG